MKHPEQEKGPSRLMRGLELIRKHPGLFPPEKMGRADKELFSSAMKTLEQAQKLHETLEGDVSPEHAAEMFAKLAEDLATHPGSRHDRGRQELEATIVSLVSLFMPEDIGLGGLLQSVRDKREGAVEDYIERIRKATLPADIQEALVLISKRQAQNRL